MSIADKPLFIPILDLTTNLFSLLISAEAAMYTNGEIRAYIYIRNGYRHISLLMYSLQFVFIWYLEIFGSCLTVTCSDMFI